MQNTQLELFKERLPGRPYCTDHLECGLQIRGRRIASSRRYVQVNPPWLRSWIVMDIDRPGAVLAWEDCNLPAPAWTSMNPENGHAHSAWGLDSPVLLGQHDRQQPMRYLVAVESAMREKIGADPGYSGLITKNPLHRHWRTLWGRESYDLGYLGEFLDLDRHKPRRGVKPETVGLGRNIDTFDWLRHYAYREIKLWKGVRRDQGVFIHWQNHLYDRAQSHTANEHGMNALDYRECHHIAKSVGRWVWSRFDIAASDARFSKRQAHRGRQGGIRSGEIRRARTVDTVTRIRAMKLARMTHQEIAEILGIHVKSIPRILKEG